MSNVNVVRTAIAGYIQSGQYVGLALPLLPNSTLNQKLGINQNKDITTEDKVAVRYLAIGNKGHGFVTGANGLVKWEAKHHTARHTGMYNQLPFVLRRVDDDLPAAQRSRYRLRRLEDHNGVSYAAYYLRVLDMSDVAPSIELRTVVDGVTTSTPYTPTLDDLNPVPPVLVAGQAVTTTGDYIASTTKVPFVMSADDIQEFVDACKIIYGSDGYAVISEMATIAGADRVVQGDFQGQQTDYVDVVRAQITSFISTAFIADFQTDGFTLNIDVGNIEPLLNVTT